jgi:hypothetical protein
MEYSIYKPTKSGKGGAAKFNVHKSGRFAFLKVAPQTAEIGSAKVFGWDDETSINVKMNIEDLAAIVSVIENFNPDVSLFHQTEHDNKIIEFKHVPDRKGFSLSVSQKAGKEAQPRSVFLGVSYTEAQILKVFCSEAIAESLRTPKVDNASKQD